MIFVVEGEVFGQFVSLVLLFSPVSVSVIPSMLLHAAVIKMAEPTQNNSLSEKQQHSVQWNGHCFS